MGALFVPTARLEFRITEFSWRDIPYFMYKRSEMTAHGTRDYLMAKWQANFPNTGFWTYIKYTIIEQHVYCWDRNHAPDCAHSTRAGANGIVDADQLADLKWKDQALLVFGFFQMAGYNRYDVSGGKKPQIVDFLDVLARLDRGWTPSTKAPIISLRKLARPPITKTRPAYVTHLSEILPYGKDSRVEAEIEHEYLPFSLAKLTLGSCSQLTPEIESICGLIIGESDSCVCWINMPTFKSGSLFIRLLARFAALVKVPSRVTTFVEMALSGSRNGTLHVTPLRSLEGEAFQLATCDIGEEACSTSFSFTKASRLRLFRGAPATVSDVQTALNHISAGA